MLKQLLALTVIFTLVTSTLSGSVKCNSDYYCNDGYKCCKKSSGGYSCCKTSTTCSSDGNKCYASSTISGAYGMGMTPAIAAVKTQIIKAPSYVDIIMMVDGFLNASKFYKNFPECTKAFTKLVSMAPQIVNLVNELKAAEGTDEVMSVIFKAVIEFSPKIKELMDESAGVPAEVKERFNHIIEVLKSKEYYVNVLTNLIQNMGNISNTITNAKNALAEQKYAQFGRYLGTVVALVLNLE